MTGAERTDGAVGRDVGAASTPRRAGLDTVDLIAEIRQLAEGADPDGVRQVITDVLSALDRVANGMLRDQISGSALSENPAPADRPHGSGSGRIPVEPARADPR